MGLARVVFIVLSVATVLLAIRMVTTQRLIHSLLLHIITLSLLGIAYLVAGAHLIGAVQIMVYAGSITVMFVFALMLTPLGHGVKETLDHQSRLRASVAAVLTFALTGIALLAIPSARTDILPLGVEPVALQLFTVYAYPFELLALVLTAALVGVAVVVGRTAETDTADAAESGDER